MKKVVISMLTALILGGAVVAFVLYQRIYAPSVLNYDNELLLFIPTNSRYVDVLQILEENEIVKNVDAFDWVAQRKNYPNKINPGRYRLSSGMNNNDLVDLLRSGNQEPVTFTFNNVRFVEEIAGKASLVIEPDSSELADFLNDQTLIEHYGFSKPTFSSMFIPNTYEFYWNTSKEEFMNRMANEYKNFWNDERKRKAIQLGLSQSQISILASIVESETKKNDEKPVVAGVYLNRLRKNMLLQADPTLVFATQDWNARRVLNIHKEIDSPYNTYKYKGLPPGPIRVPEQSSIDAVLNAASHDYLFFCAKEDFSGYHSFAKTYAEHKRNARRFQSALNQKGVYK